MPAGSYIPKKTIEITEEQMKKLQDLIPWGMCSELFRCIIDDVIALCEEHGPIVVSAMIAKKVRPIYILDTLKNVSNLIDDLKRVSNLVEEIKHKVSN